MSGGSYNYAFHHIDELAGSIRDVGGCGDYAASPTLRRAFKQHLVKVAAACQAIEWNDSGDGNRLETDLINDCLAPSAELVQAIADAAAALDALKRAQTTAKKTAKK